MYPLTKMEAVVSALSRNENTEILLFGGGQYEITICEEWCNKYPHVKNYAGKLSLNEELSQIKQLDIMISMDSANMHLASLVGTRVISIWGATHPHAGFLGWKQSHEDIIQQDMDCRPCSVYGNKPCFRKDYACMETIAPEQIIKKISQYVYADRI
jgi:ADP-heptose:LPS heptosyltransferase